MNNCIKIAHINIRSLVPKLNDLVQFVVEHNLDVLIISETWLGSAVHESHVSVDGYRIFRKDRDGRGGGVAILLRDCFNASVIDTSSVIEQIWIAISIHNIKFIVGGLYRPPQFDYKLFLSELECSLISCLPVSNTIVCGGDLNIDLLQCSSVTSYFSDFIESVGLKQIVDQPTRIAPNSASLIDVLLISDDIRVYNTAVVDCEFSDHDFIFCIVECDRPVVEPVIRTYRDFKNIDYQSFSYDLITAPLHYLFKIEDIDNKVEFFNNQLLNLFDKHAPFITRRFTKPRAPWLTDNIKLLMSLRDKAKAKYRLSKSIHSLEYYKSLRNLTTKSVRLEKKAYYSFICKSQNGGSLWKNLKHLNLKSMSSAAVPSELGNVDDINNFFVNSAPGCGAVGLGDLYNGTLDKHPSFSLQCVDEDTVLKIISSMKSSAPGSDGVTSSMLKMCCPIILPYITHIVNICIEKSVFPNVWKCAIVCPLPKTSKPQEFKDLRPINILTTMSKILERVIYNQAYDYINVNSILPTTQSGFRKGFSCTTALLKVTDDIISATDRGLSTVLIVLDYSKAFETVDHGVLLSILRYIGFREGCVQLFRDYLYNRNQRVRLAGSLSGALSVTRGVPQGSILGPLLFSIYTSQIFGGIQYCSSHIYADDTQLYYSFPPSDWRAAVHCLNSDLKKLYESSVAHSLTINPAKSQAIMFGSVGQCASLERCFEVKLNNQNIPFVPEVKSLGLIIDNGFRYRAQISKYINTAYFYLKRLYSYRDLLNTDVKKKLCETYILSQFNYCASVYHTAIDANTSHRIQLIQNCCLRYIFGLRKFDRVSHTLRDAGWLCMKDRREAQTLSLYHKIILFKSPPYLYNKITFRCDVHTINTRFRSLISPPAHRTALFQRSFSYNVCSKYNDIPSVLKELKVGLFCIRFKEILFDSAVMSGS